MTTTLFAGIADGVFYWETILWLLAALVALYFVSQLFSFLQGFGMAKITADVMQTIRREIDEKMHRLKLNYYDVHTHGDILSVITNDVDTINNTISQNLTAVVTQVTMAAGVMKASEKYYGEQQELLGKLNGYVEEMYNGQTVVQTFHYQERAKKEFARLNDALKTSSRKAETTAGAVSPITTRLCWNIPGVLRSRFLLLQEWQEALARQRQQEIAFSAFWMQKRRFRTASGV